MSKGNSLKFTRSSIYKVAWTVLILAVIVSIFIRSPFRFFDEQVHYIRAVGVGNGQLLSYSNNGKSDELGHAVDESNIKFVDGYIVNIPDPVSVGWLDDDMGDKNESYKEVYVANTSAAPYMPVPYLSYGFASMLAQAMNASVRTEFIMMRLLGAVVSLGIIFAAFRLSPEKYKWTILAIALVPMSISAFGAISLDGFTIAIGLLFMASIMSVVDRIRAKKLSNRDIGILATASLLLVTAKMPMFLMIALILGVAAVFWKKINVRQRIYLFSIIIVTALITLAWAYYAKDINTGAFWGKDVDTMRQLQYIAANPLIFLRNIGYAMLNYEYINVPYNLYANNPFMTSMPFVVDVTIIAGIVLSPFVLKQQQKTTKKNAWIYKMQVLLFVVISAAIFTLLYLQFTTVGTPNKIEGVQSRYFLPFVVLLAMCPYVFKLSDKWRSFAYTAPFVGVFVYLVFIAAQLI